MTVIPDCAVNKYQGPTPRSLSEGRHCVRTILEIMRAVEPGDFVFGSFPGPPSFSNDDRTGI
jgi:hypothetical protein